MIRTLSIFLSLFLAGSVCVAQPVLIGCDSASGRDSSELAKIYGVIKPDWVRSQGVNATDIEATPGVYGFTRLDAMLVQNDTTNAFFNGQFQPVSSPLIMFNIHNPPAWWFVSQAVYIKSECTLVAAILNHAPGRLHWIEFINEPNESWLPGCKTRQDAATFTARLAVAVRQTILAIDPTVREAGPSLSAPYDDTFISVFAANGGAGAITDWTFHDYRMSGTTTNSPTYSPFDTGPNFPPLAGCVAELRKYADLPIYVTELGLGTADNASAYSIKAGKLHIAGLSPTYFLGCGQFLGYWQCTTNAPKPNGSAFLAALRALNATP